MKTKTIDYRIVIDNVQQDYVLVKYNKENKSLLIKNIESDEILELFYRYNSWRIKETTFVWTKDFLNKYCFDLQAMLDEYVSKGGELIDGIILNKTVKGITKKRIIWKKVDIFRNL